MPPLEILAVLQVCNSTFSVLIRLMLIFFLLLSSLILQLEIAGSLFLVLSGPVLVIAFLSIFHLIISGDEEFQQ
jgi:hypothetical protein